MDVLGPEQGPGNDDDDDDDDQTICRDKKIVSAHVNMQKETTFYRDKKLSLRQKIVSETSFLSLQPQKMS